MIVRNEGAVIERCLDSVKPFISSWAISDTGSTDQTPELIKKSLAGFPGELSRDEWVDFSHNRNLALNRAMKVADYILLIDADMVLNVTTVDGGSSFPSDLRDDAYLLRFTGPLDYAVIRLVSTRHHWEYSGVVHEAICSSTSKPASSLPHVTITHFEDGSARADKFEREIRVLSEALEKDPDNARTVFYLASSYQCAGKPHQAIELFQRRIGMRGLEEESWYSLYQLGRLQHALFGDFRIAFFTLLQAYQVRPSRLEPLLPLVAFFNEHKQYHLAFQFSRLITEVGYPGDLLFIERSVYDYLLPYHYAISCHHTGRQDEAKRILEIISRGATTPPELVKSLSDVLAT